MDPSFKDILSILLLFSFDTVSLADSSSKGHYACETVGGMSRNKACIFPFKNPFNGATHNACTHDHGLPAWCATRVNSDGTMPSKDYIGFCGPDCEVEEHATCYASLSKTASKKLEKFSKLKTCVFPFIYKGHEYRQCAPYNRGSNSYPEDSDTPICATAIHHNGTLADWGYCLSDCPGAGPAKIAINAVGRREARGTRCVFPFFDGRWYTQCKQLPHGRKSCATELKENGEAETDQWAYCDKEDSSECTTVGGAKWGQNCRFPFRSPWSNKLHWSCTTDVLPESMGSRVLYPNAPWCATNTDYGDMMGATDWGYCSESCSREKDNFCYADTGSSLGGLERCIFPFVFNGQKYNRCTEHDGNLKCATKVNVDGLATALDMKTCASPQYCSEKNTVNGSPVSFGYQDVASYTNYGSSCMTIDFEYSTGFEDSTSSNWNVDASMSAEFSYFGAEFGGSLTAGGGGAEESSTSSRATHSLSYFVSPNTRVTFKQMVAEAGDIKAHTFKIKLVEVLLNPGKEANGVIHGERDKFIYLHKNGTLIESLTPCTTVKTGGNSDNGGEDDGGDNEDDEDDEEDDCSNEQYGEKGEDGKKNQNCSKQSQEEANEKEGWEALGSFEGYFSDEEEEEKKSSTTELTTTTTTKTTTTKRAKQIKG